MKAFCLLLMVAGWLLVVAAIAMLKPAFEGIFAAAGVAVELLGLVLLAHAHAALAPTPRQERRY